MSTDGNSPFEGFWDATTGTVTSAIDAYGWVIPAIALTFLLLAVMIVVGWLIDDIPFGFGILRGIRGIFRWTRARWGPPVPD